jgi:hypothetical protein
MNITYGNRKDKTRQDKKENVKKFYRRGKREDEDLQN